ncbi:MULTISPECIES: sporulation protein YpjB [Paenibacillus]|uniref:Sporulation protein YpjB n=1 Tax=Paenibacillus albilobatus TaxID=2716884 RepID=A0A920CAH2_9BACL|nr:MULTISPECIES: sporulation protein YpjB [Paenibacillus]GIO30898.1 hypothetical protein J2TS6_20390 [Paenibacillus albilobatus]
MLRSLPFNRKYRWFIIWLAALILSMQAAAPQAFAADRLMTERPEDAAKQAAALSRKADELYQHVLAGDINQTKAKLQEINVIFESSPLQKLTTVEGMHALSESIIEMKEAIARVQIDKDQWFTASAKLRMAADSLNNPKQPIWLQYYKLIREELNLMRAGLDQGDMLGVKKAYDRLQEHYEVIRPAVIIQRTPSDVTMADSWMSYMGGLVNAVTPKPAEVESMIGQGEEMFNGLFGKKKDYPALAPLEQVDGSWPWLFWGGAFIAVILAYTAYRKYRGEKNSFKKVTPRT